MELENFKYNLTRLKKCDEAWDDMKPVEGGRICKSCSKTIIDFSNMSFTEIAIFMSESNKPVCGFYLPDQLQKIKQPRKQLPLTISLTTLLTAMNADNPAFAYVPVEQSPIAEKCHHIIEIQKSERYVNPDTVYIKGNIQVFDSIKNINVPVSYASVIVKGSTHGVLTMDNGDFKLPYSKSSDNVKITLVLSSVGHETKEIELILKKQSEIDLGIVFLEQYKGGLTEFYVTVKRRSKLNRFWRNITKPFRQY